MREGEGRDEGGVDDGVNGGGGADAEAERGDDRDGEPDILAQHAQAEADVLE